jgi:hypothetical protein
MCRYATWKTITKQQNAKDSPKVNVFCALSMNMVHEPFYFAIQIITGTVYNDTWLMPQLEEDCGNTFFFKDSALPPFPSQCDNF